MRMVLALLVMLSVPLFIPVLPVPGLPGLIAGGLGGYIAGAAARAALLALLPFVLVASAITLVGFGVGLPGFGSAIALIALLWLLAENVALLLGATIGGAVAASRARRTQFEGPALERPRVTVVRSTDLVPTAADPRLPAVGRTQEISRSGAP